MGAAFAVAAGLAALALAGFGAGERGTDIALQVTARWSFLLFWLAYAGAPMATLFGATLFGATRVGPAFRLLQRHGRDFGLAFAAAHLVHVGLVGWLCWIGTPPATAVFVFFSVPLLCVYLLALSSIGRVQHLLGRTAWRVVRIVGMNYIGYAFAVDFLGYDLTGGLKGLFFYLPFAVLSVVGAAFYWTAFAVSLRKPQKALP